MKRHEPRVSDMTARLELSGLRFSRLTAVSYLKSRIIGGGKVAYWLCLCDCGKTTEVSARNLRSGQVRSCGCLRRDVSAAAQTRLDHGHHVGGKASPTWRSWHSMTERCRWNLHYIQRGIIICERWSKFRNFLEDMGERPLGHTLDRYPNCKGNYEPSNCRWATPKQQANNRGKA